MKKIISLIILIFLIASSTPAQKVNFYLKYPRTEADTLFLVDVYANVLASQIWNVGPTNIRIKYWTTDPVGGITLIPEDPVSNASLNLSNNANYYDMTSNSIMSDSAVSFNIQQLLTGTAFSLSSSDTWLGTLKFHYIAGCCIKMQILPISAVFNGLWTPMVYPTDWTYTFVDSCLIAPSGIKSNNSEIPSKYTLSQNYPNPFNPTTSIKFSIPNSGLVTLKVYDILGREIAELVNQVKSAGTYIVDYNASKLTSGIYFYKLEVNDFIAVKKMVLIK
jgi:hypothetical protein